MTVIKVERKQFTVSGLPYVARLECDSCHRSFTRETNAPDGGQVQVCQLCHTPEIVRQHRIKYQRQA